MGTNLTRNAAPSGSNMERAQYSDSMRWEDLPDGMTWDSSDPETWDGMKGTPGGTNPGTNMTREAAPA
jgi:hypothetical protein